MAAGEHSRCSQRRNTDSHRCQGAHQNLDLAETSFVAHSFMRNSGGSGSDSVGLWRPTTWYWWRLNAPCRIAGDRSRQS